MTTPPLVEVPSSSCAARIVMTLIRKDEVTESPFTFSGQSFLWPGERWMLEFYLPIITSRAVASDWIAFGLSLKGRYGRFLYGDPSAKIPRGIATGTPLVDGANLLGNILPTKGWTPNVTGIMKKGDYIQLGSGLSSRLHMVVADANSNGSGNASLSIEPAIVSSPVDSSAVVVNDAKGLFRLDSSSWSWTVEPGPKYPPLSFSALGVVDA